MSNFRFAKIIAGVGPTLAKETILSKIINMVDVFRISLSEGFDDNNRKYIDTILKLDNSKTIMMETRGNDSRVKNISNIKVKKGQKIIVDYSEYAQEGTNKIYVDYPYFGDVPDETKIEFEQSWVTMEVTRTEEDYAYCKVISWWEILQYDRIAFDKQVLDMPFFLEKDKKDILRGLEHGIHMVAASWVKSKEDIQRLRDFLEEHNHDKLKIFAKIETKEAIDNLDDLIDISDWLILVFDKLETILENKKLSKEDIIKTCKSNAKPVIVTYVSGVNSKKYELCNEKNIEDFSKLAVDGFMIETMIVEEAPLQIITELNELLQKHEDDDKIISLKEHYEDWDFIVRDYIIYNAFRITEELDIKAIVCYTENGYTTSRLASLAPKVPIIAFTKLDETYRFLNSLRGVKWYKISQSFNYENLKRIGKEMIRIIFKGNISLDDKIIIVQANELSRDEKTDMINGVELYKFKNI